MSFKRQKINGGLDAVAKRVKTPGTVDVGIIDAGKHDDSDLTVASIGYAHEYGVGVPERSFMRSTIREKKRATVKLQTKLLKKVQAGTMSQDRALGILGDAFRGWIEEKIESIKTPPNAPSTLAMKAPKTNPLIDTGQLHTSITFEVNR